MGLLGRREKIVRAGLAERLPGRESLFGWWRSGWPEIESRGYEGSSAHRDPSIGCPVREVCSYGY
jgi:hypothetical protein